MTRIILVRHGQTEWNSTERFRGHADVPLDKIGLAQAEATGKYVARLCHPVAIYAAPLSRTIKTAEAIARQFNLPVESESGLIDVDCGQWQGLTPDEVRQRWPREFEQWLNLPGRFGFPGGESLEDARLRAMQTLNALLNRHTGQDIVLVSHTALNRLILLSALGLGCDQFWNLRQDTCAVNVLETRLEGFVVVSLNNTAHLLAGMFDKSINDKAQTV